MKELEMLDEVVQPDFTEVMEAELAAGKEIEDEKLREASPKGMFTSQGLSALGEALSKAAPLFDAKFEVIEDEIPTESEVIPPDAFKLLVAISEASQEAEEAGAIDSELAFGVDDVINDSMLFEVAAIVDMLSSDREFKKFLSEPAKKVEKETEVIEVEEEEIPDDILLERI